MGSNRQSLSTPFRHGRGGAVSSFATLVCPLNRYGMTLDRCGDLPCPICVLADHAKGQKGQSIEIFYVNDVQLSTLNIPEPFSPAEDGEVLEVAHHHAEEEVLDGSDWNISSGVRKVGSHTQITKEIWLPFCVVSTVAEDLGWTALLRSPPPQLEGIRWGGPRK